MTSQEILEQEKKDAAKDAQTGVFGQCVPGGPPDPAYTPVPSTPTYQPPAIGVDPGGKPYHDPKEEPKEIGDGKDNGEGGIGEGGESGDPVPWYDMPLEMAGDYIGQATKLFGGLF